MSLRIGTRGSALARVQAGDVARRLEALGQEVDTVILHTAGDRHGEKRFEEVGPPGVFVAEIERALEAGRIDLAVHSCKDLPSVSPDCLVLAAIPERVGAEDVLVSRAAAHDPSSQVLPISRGGRVGTASARRQSLVRDLRPDLEVVHLRGNVPTRIRRLRENNYGAILLAGAGLERLQGSTQEGESPLDLDGLIVSRLDPEVFVPAPAQGAVALQARRDDADTVALLRRLDDPEEHRKVRAERELLRLVDGGCGVPFGACAPVTGKSYNW